MKKTTKATVAGLISTAVSVSVVLCAAFSAAGTSVTEEKLSVALENTAAGQTVISASDEKITTHAEEKPEDAVAVQPAERPDYESMIINMLNLNHCYNAAFSDSRSMAVCSAVTLSDYSSEDVIGNRTVNASLVAGFMKSFYGAVADISEIGDENGQVVIEPFGCGTVINTPVSVTEDTEGFTVVSCMEMYYGGSNSESRLVRSRFVKNAGSEFGLNLISSEVL